MDPRGIYIGPPPPKISRLGKEGRALLVAYPGLRGGSIVCNRVQTEPPTSTALVVRVDEGKRVLIVTIGNYSYTVAPPPRPCPRSSNTTNRAPHENSNFLSNLFIMKHGVSSRTAAVEKAASCLRRVSGGEHREAPSSGRTIVVAKVLVSQGNPSEAFFLWYHVGDS